MIIIRHIHRKPHKPTPDVEIFIGRPSPLGNPYRIPHDGQRTMVIRKYKNWLTKQISGGNRDVLEALEVIRDLHLADKTVALLCFCRPRECHGDVIKYVVESRQVKFTTAQPTRRMELP